MYSNLSSEDFSHDLAHCEDEFLLFDGAEHSNFTNNKHNNKRFRCKSIIIKVFGCLILCLIIASIVSSIMTHNNTPSTPTSSHGSVTIKTNIPSNSDMNMDIKMLFDSATDVVYYFEEGIKESSSTNDEKSNCILLSRYQIYPNTTSLLTHQDIICFDEEFGYLQPVLLVMINI